ncbi:GABA transporter 1-like isoform X2 [Tasmannia lanceolata]|uniref:GABA transporter 1-like isoform X2 n=1 Tax=Tasmannia lanceolata TaxID=3420 RepID=UPI004064C872
MSIQRPNTMTQEHRVEEEEAKLEPSPLATEKLDAGASFVLKSKGSWLHCSYHLTTSIAGPPILSLPFAFAFLGWVAGVVCLTLGALVTFYSYNLISLVLEHHAKLGHRHLRFKDMAHDILGPIQFAVCYAAVVICTLLGGQSMKAIYLLSNPNGAMKLYEFVAILGVLMLVLAQIPSFHSLRHINLVSLLLSLAYSACATAGSIYVGSSSKASPKDYSIKGDPTDRLFGIFNALAIIATAFGSGIIPEIQATLAPPTKGKMFRGLCVCYVVITVTFFSVAIAGYWAFGNLADGTILGNLLIDGKPLVPIWFLFMTNVFTLLQVAIVGVVYLQPTNVVFERKFADPKKSEFSIRNVVPRLISRSFSVVVATILAAMFPFFGDISAVIGAFGIMPLDFVLPVVFYNVTFKPSKRSLIFWVNITIASVFSVVGVIGAVSSVRQVILDAKTYRLFANV